MKKVIFLVDDEAGIKKGQEKSFEDATARYLVNAGVAKYAQNKVTKEDKESTTQKTKTK